VHLWHELVLKSNVWHKRYIKHVSVGPGKKVPNYYKEQAMMYTNTIKAWHVIFWQNRKTVRFSSVNTFADYEIPLMSIC